MSKLYVRHDGTALNRQSLIGPTNVQATSMHGGHNSSFFSILKVLWEIKSHHGRTKKLNYHVCTPF